MDEKWCRYNTLTDAITELAIPSEKAIQWTKAELQNHHAELSEEESTLFEWLLPQWHREFLQHKNYPAYAIKTSLVRLANRDEDARGFWNDAILGLRDTPAALSIIKLSMMVYPLIDLAINRRQLCQAIIIEIKRGNLKPYVYPDSLEDRGLSDREKLQAYLRLPLTEQVFAIIELDELGRGLTTTETFQRQAHTLWKRYYDRARLTDEPPPPPPPEKPKLKRNVAAQKIQILREIEEQGLDPMNIKLKEFKAKFLLDYPEMTVRMFMNAWWKLSDESKVRSDRYTLKN